ncbi:protein of unknown function [Taphrina deformans PYCC 5710]|uniref:Uncharacterized protein n=1 Tax=Taphrina deformans (strain PYCC 5710 / ATCC 11124 / CBS 356.35 / IMI 108563 / JCM 9778 / NBRC 8474) TaxID=1097556 RepID=R4X7H3_TAPDE|nr:protein of unknown function [Taphrina deformans PYCC 5710]|eukprot:CCG81356.1 protein of unknown function [Taphrina deformans PYCC 5710]
MKAFASKLKRNKTNESKSVHNESPNEEMTSPTPSGHEQQGYQPPMSQHYSNNVSQHKSPVMAEQRE